jgi:uncharacterized protein
MTILIIGATGFIGRELMKELLEHGHKPLAVSRNVLKAREILGNQVDIAEWNGLSPSDLARHLSGVDAIINLAGENIASGRWTSSRKKQIIESRVRTGMLLSEAILQTPVRPSVLIQGSAIGFYGTPVNDPAREDQPAGTGFMAELVKEWEDSVAPAIKVIPRVVYIRSGLVLGKNGGLMQRMLLPFKFYCGAVIGSGKQWMSWIHISDLARAIRFLAENTNSTGPYNITAPNPANMRVFMKSTGKILNKPVWFKVPSFLLKAALGEMAQETILSSQNIYPGKLEKAGFQFDYPELEPALRNLLNDRL